MTPVVFHTGLADKTNHLLRLVRKASRQGARLLVLCEQPGALSQALWGLSPSDFVAHATLDGSPATVTSSAVLLCDHAPVPGRDCSADVLINATAVWPSAHRDFARVIELVGQDPADVAAGRERWRLYRANGVEPEKHG
jgi:DNA polymerase-3 subunit chi